MKCDVFYPNLIIYINKKCLDINYYNKNILEDYIKDLVLKIKKIYKYKISGTYEVYIYENKSYGLIIKFIKKDCLDFFPDLIDLKLSIIYDSDIYLEFDDYFIIKKYKNIYYYKDKYYIKINDLIKIDLVILSEFYSLVYGDELELLKKHIKLLKS